MKRIITIADLYDILFEHEDPKGWWPARNDWEIVWGSVLIQNTNWKNVDLVLPKLYTATGFLPKNIRQLNKQELEELIKSAGFFTRKAQTIINLVDYFGTYNDNLETMRLKPRNILRDELTSIVGIGSETADAILLYVLQKSVFMVDNYSRRIFTALDLDLPKNYEAAQIIIEDQLPELTLRGYQNFHAVIVQFNQDFKLPQQFEQTYLKDYQLELV